MGGVIGFTQTISGSLAAAALVCAAGPVRAAEPGFYSHIAAGFGLAEDSDLDTASTSQTADFDPGVSAIAALGRAYGNGIGAEFEIGYHGNDIATVSGAAGSGDVEIYSLMLNGRYQYAVDRSVWPVRPFVRAGIGIALADVDGASPVSGSSITDSDGGFAWQAGAGVTYDFGGQFDLTLEYRYFAVPDLSLATAAGVEVDSDYSSHSVMIGLRYRFGAAGRKTPPPAITAIPAIDKRAATAIQPAADIPERKPRQARPAKPAASAALASKAAATPESYLLFFDWGRWAVTPKAGGIVAAAARNAQRTGATRIEITGHADRSGPAEYNMTLSRRRAASVKAELVRKGVAAEIIKLFARGETQPLVPTGDGVRSAQNRRAEIILKMPRTSQLHPRRPPVTIDLSAVY